MYAARPPSGWPGSPSPDPPAPNPIPGRRPYTEGTASLAPGAVLVLYTDGLIERRDESLDRGLARLVAALEGLRGLDADAICDRLLAQLGSRRDDDVALLVARTATAAGPPARG